jgi:alkyl hydroperoxide reductase subunit AhpC
MDLCRIGESDLHWAAGDLQAQSFLHLTFLGMEKVLFARATHHPVVLVSISAARWPSDWRTGPKTRRMIMTLQIGDLAPDFETDTTEGRIRFHEWIGDSWAVLFSHPKDFTPVCTTELGYMARIKPEFDKRNTKIIGLSVDPLDSHARWAADIKETQGFAPNYPMIGDSDLSISKAWGMLPASMNGDATKRTAVDNQTVRNVFIIGPDKRIKLILVYPMTTGRNFDEVLRVLDSLQLTAKHKVATPVNWEPGEDVIIAGSVSDDEAKKTYPKGWKAPRPYMRIVPQPGR